MTPVAPQTSKPAADAPLIPDIALLIEARVKAGEKNANMKGISNLILHDPVLTLEFLNYANSIMFGGAAVTDVEAAVTRLGTTKLIGLLAELNAKDPGGDPEVREVIEILRYNCRRYSIVTLILAGVLNPALVVPARATGLFADVGHMVAALRLGKKYCELAKGGKRNTLPFRLQKDHNFDVNKELIKVLKAKSIPRLLMLPYDLDEKPKSAQETALRNLVGAAKELIEAYDAGKWGNYAPDKPLPANSALRMLSVLPFQQQRIHQAVEEYLKMAAAEEAPEGANLLICAAEGEELQPLDEAVEAKADTVMVPRYPNLSVSPKSRAALREFFELCEGVPDNVTLRAKSVESLKKSGIFARAAIVKISGDGTNVQVENEAGLNVKSGDAVNVPATHEPLSLVKVEIRSAKIKSKTAPAPFGTTAFGLGPVETLPSGEKRALYVDSSSGEPFKIESRRVFRLVLGLLSQKLTGGQKIEE